MRMKKETEVFILSFEEKEMLKTILKNIVSHAKRDKKDVVFKSSISKTQFIFSPQGLKNLKKMANVLEKRNML